MTINTGFADWPEWDALRPELSVRALRDRLDRLAISADAKAILHDLLEITVKVGKGLVHLGRKIVEVALALLQTFPNVAFGAIIALVVSMLIAQIALVGAALSAILGPLLLAFGVVQGALVDLKNGDIGDRVKAFVDKMIAELSANTK